MDRLLPEPFLPMMVGGHDVSEEGRARDSLFLMARLRTPSLPDTYTVRVRNLSAGGLMAEFETPLDRDTPIEVEVRGLGWVPGRVAWFTQGRTGVAFDTPIDPQRARKPVGPARVGPGGR